jgi:hypothetical protein
MATINETNTATIITPMGGVGGAATQADGTCPKAGGTCPKAGGVGGGAPQIFRYKLSDNIMLLITQFAKMHQYDDRHSYKEAWHEWLNDNSEVIEREISRLEQLGYKGDVNDKMFKAGRYYFREKESLEKNNKNQNTNSCNDDKDDNNAKRTYCVMNPDVIKAMDKHLQSIMTQPNFKPAHGYKQFCEQHMTLLREEIARLVQEELYMTAEKMAEKIKKTYKNRYYILAKQ